VGEEEVMAANEEAESVSGGACAPEAVDEFANWTADEAKAELERLRAVAAALDDEINALIEAEEFDVCGGGGVDDGVVMVQRRSRRRSQC
jgi:hypothetical protein